jgi:hypothetical protein
MPLERLHESLITDIKLEQQITARFFFDNAGRKAVRKDQLIVRLETATRPRKRRPATSIPVAGQVKAHRDVVSGGIAGWPDPSQGRWQHPRIVKNQNITCAQKGRQVPDGRILKASVPMHDEQARTVLRLSGPESDQLLRQIKLEF